MLERILIRMFGDGFEKDWWVGVITQGFFVTLAAVVLAIGGLWYFGGQPVEHEGKINLSAPANLVFRQLVEPESRMKWQSDAVSIARDSSGELKAKSQFKLKLKAGGKEEEATDVVMQVVPEEWFSFRTSAPHLSRVTVFKLRQALDPETDLPLEGVVELTYRCTERAGETARIWAGLSRPDVKSRVEAELAKIKELVESTTTPGS